VTNLPTGSGSNDAAPRSETKAAVIASGDSLAAKRYALAALDIAKEHGTIAEWADALSQIGEFMTDPGVRRVLENTRVSQGPKQNLVNQALADLPVLPLNLARLLVRKHRTALAGEISSQFDRLVEADSGIEHARAVTAVPLSDAERVALEQRLQDQTGHRVILDIEVDPALLGGLVVQIGDRLIDASMRARLQAMRESLVGAL